MALFLSNVSITASADALIAYFRKHYGNASFHYVYECGPFGFNLCRQLWSAGIECIVVNPADIPGTDLLLSKEYKLLRYYSV
jgi:transposase